jgi:hypothetical protein
VQRKTYQQKLVFKAVIEVETAVRVKAVIDVEAAVEAKAAVDVSKPLSRLSDWQGQGGLLESEVLKKITCIRVLLMNKGAYYLQVYIDKYHM